MMTLCYLRLLRCLGHRIYYSNFDLSGTNMQEGEGLLVLMMCAHYIEYINLHTRVASYICVRILSDMQSSRATAAASKFICIILYKKSSFHSVTRQYPMDIYTRRMWRTRFVHTVRVTQSWTRQMSNRSYRR